MDSPITPADVEAEIVRLSALLDTATTEIARRARDAAEKHVAYKRSEAVAYLHASGSIPERKAQALTATADEFLASEVADARVLAAREAAHNTRSQLDALRSVAANVRAQV